MTPNLFNTATGDIPTCGNLIPNSWFFYITNSKGNPDSTAINLLAEIYYWYRPKENGNNKFYGDILQLKYSELESKLNVKKEAIRRAFVRLEERGLVRRELRTVIKPNACYSNVLFVHLDIKKLMAITPDIDKALLPSDLKKHSTNKNIIAKKEDSYPLYGADIYKDLSKAKSLSSEKIDDKNKIPIALSPKTSYWNKEEFIQKPLLSFLPLTSEFIERLNESISKNLPAAYYEDAVLALYQADRGKFDESKITCAERQLVARLIGWVKAEKRSDDDILIAYGLKEKPEHDYKSENILAKYEVSLDASLVGVMKRKIAGEISKEMALYLLLQTYITISGETIWVNQLRDNNPFDNDQIKTELMPIIKSIIGEGGEIIIKPPKQLSTLKEIDVKLPDDPLFSEVGKDFIESYGKGIYKSWFEKLRFIREDCNEGEKIIIITESEFRSDYIRQNYLDVITQLIKYHDKRVVACKVDSGIALQPSVGASADIIQNDSIHRNCEEDK